MKEKIRETYKDKASAYIAVLDDFDKEGIEYIILNLLVADDNPGDLDVLICNNHQGKVGLILRNNGFSYYTKYEKGQYLWNKYLKGVGFVQFHIYESLHVCGREYFAGSMINTKLQHNIKFHFFVFLIESLYKEKLRVNQYRQYKNSCTISLLQKYVQENSPSHLETIKYILNCYEVGKKISCNERKKYLWKRNFLNRNQIFLWKVLRRIRNLFDGNNIYVLFIGVDGAGKTTLIDQVYQIFAKGGIYPQKRYLGLRESLFAPKKEFRGKKSECISEKTKSYRLPLNFPRFVKLLLYWGEYNIKYLIKVKLHPYGSRTAFLIDRCYVDLLFYYPYQIVRDLLIKYSFVPNKIIFLTGNKDILYRRKEEMGRDRFDMNYNFYYKLASILTDQYNKSVFNIDTTKRDLNEATLMICDYIMGIR